MSSPSKKPKTNNPNNVATKRIKNSRIHNCNPNDGYRCEPCGVVHYQSIYQHQFFQCACPQSVYYLTLQDKMFKAYQYLLQRHKEDSVLFKAPGAFVMISCKMSNDLMENKLSLEILQQQDKNWNVLMPIVLRVAGGKPIFGKKTVFELMAELVEENDVGAGKFDWLCDKNGKIETKWKLQTDWMEGCLSYTKEEQQIMEETRDKQVKELAGKLHKYQLPCTGKAHFDGIEDEMPLLKK